MPHPHVAGRDAKLIGDNLGEDGLGALAVGRDTGVDLHVPVRSDDTAGVFFQEGHLSAGTFHHRRNAHTDERPGVL